MRVSKLVVVVPVVAIVASVASVAIMAAGCAALLGTGDELEFGVLGDAGGDGAPTDSGSPGDAADALGADVDGGGIDATVDDAGRVVVWEWDPGTATGWAYANVGRDGSPLDCCGCGTCGTCTNNPSLIPGGPGIMTFTSGPSVSGGSNHQTDGFAAWRTGGVPVLAGKPHTVTVTLAALDARIDGAVGTETGDAFRPRWSIQIREGFPAPTILVAQKETAWGTAQCKACYTTDPADIGPHTLAFVPTGTNVDLALSATHHSSQCASEVHDVYLNVTSIRVTSP